NVVAIAAQRRLAFSPSHTEEISTEVRAGIETGSAASPVPTVPISAGRPRISGSGMHPTGTTRSRAAGTWADRPAHRKDRSAAAINPQPAPINAPALVVHARRAADLALQPDLSNVVVTAVLAVAVVRLAGDPLIVRSLRVGGVWTSDRA